MGRRREFRIACLLGTLLVCGVIVHFIHGFQVTRTARLLLHLADRAEDQKHSEAAAEYLRRYLVYDPNNKDALAKYALTLSDLAKSEKQLTRAFLALEQALRCDSGRGELRRKIVPIAMQLGRFTDAQEHLEVLVHEVAPNECILKQLLGKCHEAKKEYEKAAAWYEKAIQDDPHDIAAYTLFVNLLRRHFGKPHKADEVMDKLVGQNEQSFQAFLARGAYRKEYGSREDAVKDFEKACELAPDEGDVLRTMADLALDQSPRDFDKARRYLQRSLELHPQDVVSHQTLARLEQGAGRRSEAIAVLRRGLKEVPSGRQPNLLWDLANLLLENEEEANEAIDGLRKAGFSQPQVDYLRARLLVNEGEWFRAGKELERLRPALLRWPELTMQADLLLGSCYQHTGNPDQQYTAYRRAETQDPSSVTASLGMASALVAMGRNGEALDTYGKLVHSVPGVRLEMVRLLLLETLRLPSSQRQWQEIDRLLEQAALVKPELEDLPLLRADVLVGKGDDSSARAVLVAGREKNPGQVRLRVALALLEDRLGKAEAARAVLDEAGRKFGDVVELRLAWVRHWARQEGSESKAALAKLTLDLDKFGEAERARLLSSLAEALGRTGDPAAAQRLWEQRAALQPRDLGVRLVLFDRALQAGDETGMNRALDEIQQIEEGTKGAFWRFGKACLLVWQAKQGKKETLDAARTLLEGVAVERPGWSRVVVCMAEIDQLKGDPTRAIRNYQRAVTELGDRNPLVIRPLVQLLFERRRYAEADLVLRKLPEEALLTPELQRLTASVAFQTQDYDRAESLARKAVANNSRDYRDYLWLGMILSASPKNRAEAEQVFCQAVRLADTKPETWVALVGHLAACGEKDKARAEIQEAQRRLSSETAALALARCYETIGDMQKAKELYDSALAANPEDLTVLRSVAGSYLNRGLFLDAEPHLQKIIALSIKAPDDAAWAKRLLAIMKAAGGDYQQSRQALDLLGIADDAKRPAGPGTGSVEDQRARALVLAMQKGRRQRREAIALLEDLLGRVPPTPDDQLLLGQLYEAVGDWPRARKQMLSLLGSQGEKPLYLATVAHALLRHEEYTDVEPFLEKLRKLPEVADGFTAAEIKARILATREGQSAEAIALLEDYVANPQAKPAVLTTRQVYVAGLLAELSRRYPREPRYAAGAEILYRKYVDQLPDKILLLASFLGHQGRTREALDLCDRAWKSGSPQAVANASVEALQGGQANGEHYRRVERSFQAALAKEPGNLGLMVCAAFLRDLQGRYDEAETLYRDVLKRDNGNIIALNNLSGLLALRKPKGAEALELITRAVVLAGPVPDLRDTRAVIYLTMGQSEAAIEDLEEALLESPTAVSHFHLAQAYLLAKKPKEARESLERAMALGLDARELHALERPAYDQMVEQFKGK
jgi:cellulose synthase operon protein C